MIRFEEACRTYRLGEVEVPALGPVSLTLEAGEFVVILGPSGSGKTTMLNLLAGLDRPTGGRIRVAGQDLGTLSPEGLEEHRRRRVGVVFQFFNLVPTLTARENVELVAELVSAVGRVDPVLEAVGLSHRRHHFPHELSGGEQQRVALARALVKDPDLLLGDEPTGNLDATSGRRVLQLLQEAHRRGKLVVLVTHNSALARLATRVLTLRAGQVASDVRREAPEDALSLDW